MDPLSVVAGVVGILAAAAQLIQGLNELGSSIKDAGTDSTAAAIELANITIVVQGLQTYVVGRIQASPQRLQMITVEHITATLTGCITTFSELDVVLKSMHVETGPKAWDRAKWLLKKDRVTLLTQRLQNHKATFTMMLNILQCTSMGEAERNMDRLCDTVNELLRTNQELCLRLRNIEDVHQPARRPHAQTGTHGALNPDTHSLRSNASVSSAISTTGLVHDTKDLAGARPSTFEEQLHRSHVYRHAAGSRSQSSLVSDARSTLALSICSSLTLGDVSKISVYALPIYTDEISNAACYDMDDQEIALKMSVQYQKEMSPVSKQRAKEQRKGLSSWWKNHRQRPAIAVSLKAPKVADSPGIFGVPLETSIRYANVAISVSNENDESYIFGYVPIIQAKCGVFLKQKGTEVPNVFLMGGSIKRVQELEAAFDSPPKYGKGLDWVGYTIHDCASILLRYYRQLPEPIIPLRLYERFLEPFRGYQLDHQLAYPNVKSLEITGTGRPAFDILAAIHTYHLLIMEMTPILRQCLLYLLDFLAVFASWSHKNLMTTARIAAVFQPTIIGHPDHQSSAPDLRQCQDVLMFLIATQDHMDKNVPDSQSQSSKPESNGTASTLRRSLSAPVSKRNAAAALSRRSTIPSRKGTSYSVNSAPRSTVPLR